MWLRFHFLVVAVGALLAACGSADADGLFGGTGGAAAGATTGAGGVSAGGAAASGSTGAGGASAGGSAASGSTGAGGAGGVSGGGTGSIGAGSGGAGAPDSGGLDASTVVFVPGGIISPQCAACAQASCQQEGAVCQADPACMQMYTCVTSCIIPLQCAACLVGSGSGPQNFNTLQCCTSLHCAGLCPSLNAGVIGCP